MVRQAEHLACRKRQPGTFAGVARTHFCPVKGIRWLRHKTVEPEGTPCRGRVSPVCRFRGGGEGGATETGISAALGRVWGGGCPDHPNSEEERLRGVLFRVLWGRSILILEYRLDISKLPLPQTISLDGVLEKC